jgi:LytS/YehU family sensor histidine kinase
VENPCVERTSTAGGENHSDMLNNDEPERPAMLVSGNKQRTNNKMALQNIRERLDLLFDAEARYQVESGKDFYRVEIALPYVKERPKLKEQSI